MTTWDIGPRCNGKTQRMIDELMRHDDALMLVADEYRKRDVHDRIRRDYPREKAEDACRRVVTGRYAYRNPVYHPSRFKRWMIDDIGQTFANIIMGHPVKLHRAADWDGAE